jgi:hypothetical protein
MQHTYSILCFLKKEKRQKGNEASILLRITVNGQRAEISTKRKINPSRWDTKSNRVKGNKEDAREINSLIDSLILRLNRIYQELIERDGIITASHIKEIFEDKTAKQKTLVAVFDQHNRMMESRVGIDFAKATFTPYKTTLDQAILTFSM